MNEKNALVTGASSGLGREIARHLYKNGFRVFGTSRKPQPPSESIEFLVLDVTSDDSVTHCVEQLMASVNSLDILVNNAGITHLNLIEETATSAAEEVMRTNFWGPVSMMRAVLPIMREQGEGTIINISSMAGLIGAPGQGYYAASKHALEGFTETLHAEVSAFGINLSLVEPGFFSTDLHHSSRINSENVTAYDSIREPLRSSIARNISEGDDPMKVAKLVTSIALGKQVGLRFRVGSDAIWVPRLKMFFPEAMFLSGMKKKFGLSR
jgi:NAD(P)-dependent dehydrogenase (short-subunit alcohol dehydrogenase family)